MSKALFELQNNIKNLRQQLSDRIHLAFLNHQSYLCVKSTLNQPFKEISSNLQSESQSSQSINLKTNIKKEKFEQNNQAMGMDQLNCVIQKKLKNLSEIFQKRSENHLNYLIIKQIQSQQQCVRRDRLTEYEQKIYDQRRLISDKEMFAQSLLRPKKQRPQDMGSEKFQQLRAIEKIEEEKAKVVALEQEINNLESFRRRIGKCQGKGNGEYHIRGNVNEVLSQKMERYEKRKSEDLERTKANSLETVNTSKMNNIWEKGQKMLEEQDWNSEIRTNKEVKNGGSSKDKRQEECQVGQVDKFRQLQKEFSLMGIEKLIESYENKASEEEVREKYSKIEQILRRIREKKEENRGKNRQCKQLQIENAHMKAQLNRTKELYLRTKKLYLSQDQ